MTSDARVTGACLPAIRPLLLGPLLALFGLLPLPLGEFRRARRAPLDLLVLVLVRSWCSRSDRTSASSQRAAMAAPRPRAREERSGAR
jgi:hypothetical protein